MSEIKSCPFCGAMPDRLHRKEPTYAINHRPGCIETRRLITEDVVAAWNTRAVDPDVERLAKALGMTIELLDAIGVQGSAIVDTARAALAPWRKP